MSCLGYSSLTSSSPLFRYRRQDQDHSLPTFHPGSFTLFPPRLSNNPPTTPRRYLRNDQSVSIISHLQYLHHPHWQLARPSPLGLEKELRNHFKSFFERSRSCHRSDHVQQDDSNLGSKSTRSTLCQSRFQCGRFSANLAG